VKSFPLANRTNRTRSRVTLTPEAAIGHSFHSDATRRPLPPSSSPPPSDHHFSSEIKYITPYCAARDSTRSNRRIITNPTSVSILTPISAPLSGASFRSTPEVYYTVLGRHCINPTATMKLFHQYLIVLILGLFQIALAVQVQKPIVVSYPDNTPDSVLNEAKKAITDAVSDISNSLLRKFILTNYS
jgi:hypothetical protein